MNRVLLSRIDEELDSSEVAALCFLCRDVVNRKRLEGINNAKDLFLRLEEKGLLDNYVFLSQLLDTIRRADLLGLLETDSRRPEETDAHPDLSGYRVMLYQIYGDITEKDLKTMKFLLTDKLGKRQTEACKTALDVFVEMEKIDLLSIKNLHELYAVLLEIDQQLAQTVHRYMQGPTQQYQRRLPSHVSMDYQTVNNPSQLARPTLSVSETQHYNVRPNVPSNAEADAESLSLSDQTEYYSLIHNPRGLCVVINNENFDGTELNKRGGTQQDENYLRSVFTRLGFTVVVHKDLKAKAIKDTVHELSTRNFSNHDALVVCVLSHGENGCVFGTDAEQVLIKELTQPFTSGRARSLAGKPKLFFIQACQGSDYQRGSMPCPQGPRQGEGDREKRLEEDAGPVYSNTVPWDADFLLGMATVPECKSFRHTSMGSIYIQELCKQLEISAQRLEEEDILTVLTRVNREVSKGEYLNYKQMPEPKYTLTKKLVLKYV